MRTSTLLVLVVACVAPAPASAQTADELIAKHVEARGGAAKLAAIQTVRIERVVAATFNNIDLVIQKFPFAIEEERDAPGQTFVHYTKRIEVNVPLDDALFRMPS